MPYIFEDTPQEQDWLTQLAPDQSTIPSPKKGRFVFEGTPQPQEQSKTSMLEDFAKGGGNILTERGLGIIQLLDEATGGSLLSPQAREASYKVSKQLNQERQGLGTTGTIANIVADPLMALPMAKGLQGAKALAATGAVAGATAGALSSKSSGEQDRLAQTLESGGIGAVAAPIAGKALEVVSSPVQTLKNAGGYLGKALGVIPENLATFKQIGVQPTLGEVSSSNIVKRAQNVIKDVPLAGGIITRGEEKVSKGIETGLAKAGFDMSLEKAVGGDAARQGLQNYITKGKQLFNNAFDEFDKKFVPSNETLPLSATSNKISDIFQRAKTPEALDVYLGGTEKGIIQKITDAIQSSPNGELSYGDAKLFRTAIGKKLEDYTIGSSEKGVLRELYGSLSEDLRQKVSSKSSQAVKAFDKLNSNYSKFITKLDDTVNKVINKGENTEIFNAIRSGVALPKKTAQIMQSLPQKNRDILRGSLIREMGIDRTMAGQGEFNAARFAGKFKALDPKAQQALLIGLPKDVQNNFMKVVDAAGLSAKTALQGNASGTQRSGMLAATLAGGANPATAALTAKLIGSSAITAKMMTSPKFIKWLANVPKQNPANLSNYIGKLSAIATSDELNKEDISNYQQDIQTNQPLKITIRPQQDLPQVNLPTLGNQQ